MDSDPVIRSLDQVVYTIMRMKRPADLVGISVFDSEDFEVDVDIAEPRSPRRLTPGEESAALPLPGPSIPLPSPGSSATGNVGPTGLEATFFLIRS